VSRCPAAPDPSADRSRAADGDGVNASPSAQTGAQLRLRAVPSPWSTNNDTATTGPARSLRSRSSLARDAAGRRAHPETGQRRHRSAGASVSAALGRRQAERAARAGTARESFPAAPTERARPGRPDPWLPSTAATGVLLGARRIAASTPLPAVPRTTKAPRSHVEVVLRDARPGLGCARPAARRSPRPAGTSR